MKFLYLNSIALVAVSINAAVVPRQETTTSPITSIPNTSATKKSFLTSITTLPMPSSVEGNTAYTPPSTTAVEITTAAQSSTYSKPSTTYSASSSQPPFTWYNNATATNSTASVANATTSSTSIFATGLSNSTSNLTTGGSNLTEITSSAKAPYANSTTNGLVGGVAATGTAVIVTGLSAANATATPASSSGNSTRPAPLASTSMLVQFYLNKPSSTAKSNASATEVPLGSNMTLVTDNDDDHSSSSSQARATVALFTNSTTTAGVAQATGVPLSTASITAAPKNNGTVSAAAALSTSTVHFSNTTLVTVTVKPNPTGNSTLPAASGMPLTNTTSSSTTPLSTGSSGPVPNAIANNGTMFAITYDNKNGTIIQLIPASNSTDPLAATGTAASVASASANLDRRNAPKQTAAPITPAMAKKGSWSKFTYAQTEYLPRPSRFFSGEGWSLSKRWSA
jgi:hypothetical protein